MYTVVGIQKKTAIKKSSKNGKQYFSIGFADKGTGRAYTVRVFADSTYTPTKSSKGFRNGAICCPVIVTCSKYTKDANNGGWSQANYNGGNGNIVQGGGVMDAIF